MINWLNAKSISSKPQSDKTKFLTKLELDTSGLGDNPWFTGFIEADGNFYSIFSFNSQGIAEEIRHYMRISQKAVYGKNSGLLYAWAEKNSNKHIMEKIREFLDVKSVNEIKRTSPSWPYLEGTSPPRLEKNM